MKNLILFAAVVVAIGVWIGIGTFTGFSINILLLGLDMLLSHNENKTNQHRTLVSSLIVSLAGLGLCSCIIINPNQIQTTELVALVIKIIATIIPFVIFWYNNDLKKLAKKLSIPSVKKLQL